jgi:hypothetical protein
VIFLPHFLMHVDAVSTKSNRCHDARINANLEDDLLRKSGKIPSTLCAVFTVACLVKS